MAESQAVLELFNLALSHVGNRSIITPDQSPECQLHYPTVRDKALTWAPWNFATFKKDLVRLADATGEPLQPLGRYLFMYALPQVPPVLRVLDIHLSSGFSYERRQYLPPNDPEHPQEIIATSAEPVVLTYIGRVSEGAWPPFFSSVVAIWLAVEISNRLSRRASLRQGLLAELDGQLTRAIDIDGHQDSPQSAILNQTYIAGRQESGVPPMLDIQEPLHEFP